jgi:hypothetical protein
MHPFPPSIATNFLDQINRTGDIDIDDVPDRGEVLIEKFLA